MRLALDIAQTSVERAGCGWYADALARALSVECAGRHELILYHHFGDWVNESCEQGTDLPTARMPLRQLTAAEARAVWRDPAHPLLGRPDLVHATSVRLPRVQGAKLVFTVHDVAYWAVPEFTTEANRVACQRGTLQAVERADGLIFISESARGEFARFLPGWLERSGVHHTVVHHGPRETPRPTGVAESGAAEPYWLAVGTLEPRKNYAALLAALPEYRRRSARPAELVVAGGGGWMSEALKLELRQLEEAGAVRYLGYVDDARLADLYAGAKALLFPSWYEGFGLPILEAMSQGCPVICSDRTSLPEVGGEVARYIDPGDPRSIAEAMLALEANGPPARELLLAQAARFSWQRAAAETLAFYERVLADPRAPRVRG